MAALVGNDGTGKTWAALDWCNAMRESCRHAAPIVLFLRARSVTGTDAKSGIAEALSKQAGRGSVAFWRGRLDLWERSGRQDIRILIVVDGLNQNFMFRDWADWAQPLLEDSLNSMYAILVTCWPRCWEDDLLKLRRLEPEPVEIVVEGFDDSELDEMLGAMGVPREELAESVLQLMRMPRMAALALARREALAKSGDVTAERVVWEDWKDRVRRGVSTGLDDNRMKEFVRALGGQLRDDVNLAVSRRNIMEILSHESGRSGEELTAAVAELTSGGWFRVGDRQDMFKLEPDKVHYALGAALLADLKQSSGANEIDARIAEFLDPLKAHSLGARILRAATTISLVEEGTSDHLRRPLTTRWIGEQNFDQEDFAALWRLAGLDAPLILSVAEREWLAAHASGFRDEVLVKTLANAAAFDTFSVALNPKLVEWLGTVWAEPGSDGNAQGDGANTLVARHAGTVRSRYADWLAWAGSTELAPLRIAEEGEWAWLARSAVAVMSYLARAPRTEALEAWALSRAIMERTHQLDEVAWILRANPVDTVEADNAIGKVLRRLKEHRHPVCAFAATNLETVVSHVRRGVAAADAPLVDEPEPRAPDNVADMEGEALLEAVADYLGPNGWKSLDGAAGAALIDGLIERGLPTGGREIDLLSNEIREIVTIIAPQSRALLAMALDREREAVAATDEPQPGRVAALASRAMLLRLFDAPPKEQSGILLASDYAPLDDDWWLIGQRLDAGDLEGLEISRASRAGLVLWLECAGQQLTKEQMRSLHFLPALATHDDREVRRRAVELAAHGRHPQALRQFASSPHAAPVSGDDRSGHLEEHARNSALLELESMGLEGLPPADLAAEAAALRVMKGNVSEAALDQFGAYLRDELMAVTIARSWGSGRYWYSYRRCVELIVERDQGSLAQWLADWTRAVGPRADWALMNDFPVLDVMRALKDKAPEVALAAFDALKSQSKKHGFFSTDQIDGVPFEVSRSKTSDAACAEILASAITDKELLDIAYHCHKSGRVDWLLEHIAVLEASRWPAEVAKAFTLLGCCDTSADADALWEAFRSRPPEHPWLRRVFADSDSDYRRNVHARAALESFWRTDSEQEARHALKRVAENCDRRIGIWIEYLDPMIDDNTPYARRLARSLAARPFNGAVKKDRDGRKKLLYHTPISLGGMAPWR